MDLGAILFFGAILYFILNPDAKEGRHEDVHRYDTLYGGNDEAV